MKKIISLSLSAIITIGSFAQQQTSKIILANDQSLKFTTTIKGVISQESIAGNMDMNLDAASTKNILVKKADKDNYLIDFKTTHLKLNMSVMGKDQTFDSDSSDNVNGEMKDLGKEVNVAKPFNLSTDNICTPVSVANNKAETKAADDMMSNMLAQMMGNGNDEAVVESYFMLIPTDKKIGDSWTDSTILTSTKRYTTYKWESTEKNIAILSVTEKTLNDMKTEMMGMDVSTNLINDVTETRKADIKTGVLLEKKSTAKISGTIEAMGVSMPVTGSVETVVSAE